MIQESIPLNIDRILIQRLTLVCCLVQQIVSIGTFDVAVLFNVLFVIVSPIDANPLDELE